ncbi:MAG: D-alanyl-D-alanine carboxypeptidase family protein [Angustibacter sp.]
MITRRRASRATLSATLGALTLWSAWSAGTPSAGASSASSTSIASVPAAAVAGDPSLSTAPVPPTASSAASPSGSDTASLTTSAAGKPVVGGDRLSGTSVVVDRPPDVPAPERFAARAWVLADADTGQVLAARAPHRRHRPASTIKTLTVLTALPLVDPDAQVLAQPDDLSEGSQVGLVPGSRYRVRQLLHATMLASGNDAATALARVAGGPGGVAAHVRRMQTEAGRLGAWDTTVRGPTGLDTPGQATSAYDLALIGRAAIRDAGLRALTRAKRALFPGKEPRSASADPDSQRSVQRRASYQIQNHNRLLWNYPGTIGVKDGFTEAARWTSIDAVTRDGRTLLLTALHRGDGSWRSEAAVFDWGFRYADRLRPVGRLVEPGELQRPAPAGTPAAGRVVAAAADSPAGADDGPWPYARTVVAVLVAAVAVTVLALRTRVRWRRRMRSHAAPQRRPLDPPPRR